MSNAELMSQKKEGIIKKFLKMDKSEKWWAITHPFVAKKAWKITQNAKNVTKQIKDDPDLDGDDNGGQIDAFRHSFWMATLSQKVHKRKAYKLGIAHEKSNYEYYTKMKNEDGTIPDSVASEMDYKNNDKGIEIGIRNKKASQQELIQIIKKAILSGELWIIKKDNDGNYLTWDDKKIKKEDWHGKWHNSRCLVPSNYKFKNK